MKLECPTCKNSDLNKMTLWDRPMAIRDVISVEDGGVLLVDSYYQVVYNGDERHLVQCAKCGCDFESPMKIEYR